MEKNRKKWQSNKNRKPTLSSSVDVWPDFDMQCGSGSGQLPSNENTPQTHTHIQRAQPNRQPPKRAPAKNRKLTTTKSGEFCHKNFAFVR